jgi:FkbM family methyltransferase
MSYFNLEWIKQYVKKDNPIIFDIGAFNFDDSINFKIYYPESDVYAFEAFYENIKQYSDKAKNYGVKVYDVALSDKNGETKFYNSMTLNGGSWTCSGSILIPTKEEGVSIHPGLKYNLEGVEVKTTTIETFCEQNDIKNVDVIHMDIQGAEYYAIKGMGKKIKPKIIFCETCEYDSYEKSLTQKDLDNLLFDLGYEIKERLIYDTFYILK